jgi:hypothetical protein
MIFLTFKIGNRKFKNKTRYKQTQQSELKMKNGIVILMIKQ